jgi:hypothetical protein
LLKLVERRKRHDWISESEKKCWATSGRYLRAHILKALVERIGHQLSEELENFERHLINDNATSKLDDKIVAHMLLDVMNEDEEALNE